RGADAARGAAGFGSVSADHRGGGAAFGTGAPSGVPAVEGLPHRGSGWFDFRSAAVASAIVLDPQDAGVEQVLLSRTARLRAEYSRAHRRWTRRGSRMGPLP